MIPRLPGSTRNYTISLHAALPISVVAVLQPAACDLCEAVLYLLRAPLLLHPVTGHRHQAVGAGDGSRRVGVEGQVLAEDLVLVDGEQHVVVVTGGLRRQRHLALDLDVAAVGAPRDGIVGIDRKSTRLNSSH